MLGIAAEAAYHRGDHPTAERLARAGLERIADDADAWYCLVPLAVAALARGAFAEAVEHALAAAALRARRESARHRRARHGLRGRPRTGPGAARAGARRRGVTDDAFVERLRRRRDRERRPGTPRRPKRHYREAMDLARRSGATFLVGVATVGLLTVLGTAGRVEDALRGYRDVVGYFARTGNWTHLWTTLRNLADLLRAARRRRDPRRSSTPPPTAPRTPPPCSRAAAGRSGASRRAGGGGARAEHHSAPAAVPRPIGGSLALARSASAHLSGARPRRGRAGPTRRTTPRRPTPCRCRGRASR